ncbi:MAG: hypothetical protein ACO3JJ_04225, partial [Opitutaceae bacterium]
EEHARAARAALGGAGAGSGHGALRMLEAGIALRKRALRRALARVRAAAAPLPGVEDRGAIDSPLRGADGNREFLLCLRRRTS